MNRTRWLLIVAVAGLFAAAAGFAKETVKAGDKAKADKAAAGDKPAVGDKDKAAAGDKGPAAPEKDPKDAKAGDAEPKHLDFAKLDGDNDEGVTLNEFLAAHVPPDKPAGQIVSIPLQEQLRLRRQFKDADHDRSNVLTKSEWEKWLAEEDAKAAKAVAAEKKDEEKIGGMDKKQYDRMRRELLKQQYRNMMKGAGG